MNPRIQQRRLYKTKRDVKCENLLMDQNFNIKLSDFGFARGQMIPKDGITPLSETFCGSYAYASPEILKGVPYLPQLSDVWSMGVVLYAMVYGRLPFDDTNYSQLLKVPSKYKVKLRFQENQGYLKLVVRLSHEYLYRNKQDYKLII